jgi:hypothetical protein
MPNYCTADEVKSIINKAGPEFDVNFTDLLIPAVSDVIDKFTNHPDGFLADSAATARIYTGDGTDVQWFDDNVEVTLVEVKDAATDTDYVAWETADWIAASGDPQKPDFNGLPFRFIITSGNGNQNTFTDGHFGSGLQGFSRPTPAPRGRGLPTVRITAKWGHSVTIPSQVNMAAIAQTALWYKRGLSAWQTATVTTALGSLPFKVDKLDPDVQLMLIGGRLVRPAIGRRY